MKVKLTINGMKCDGCVKRISNILEKTEGINSYNINLETKVASIEITSESIIEIIKEKIENLDFSVTNIELEN